MKNQFQPHRFSIGAGVILLILLSLTGCAPSYRAEILLCEEAFSVAVEQGIPSAPILMLKISDWKNENWKAYSHPFVPPVNNQDAKTLVCIRESREDTSDIYIGMVSVDPYRLIWDIRVVDLTSGRVLGSGRYTGGDPPSSVSTTGYGSISVYGQPPIENLLYILMPPGQIFNTDHGIKAIAFSLDGSFLASTGGSLNSNYPDTQLQMWDVATGKEIVIFENADEGRLFGVFTEWQSPGNL